MGTIMLGAHGEVQPAITEAEAENKPKIEHVARNISEDPNLSLFRQYEGIESLDRYFFTHDGVRIQLNLFTLQEGVDELLDVGSNSDYGLHFRQLEWDRLELAPVLKKMFEMLNEKGIPYQPTEEGLFIPLEGDAKKKSEALQKGLDTLAADLAKIEVNLEPGQEVTEELVQPYVDLVVAMYEKIQEIYQSASANETNG